MTDADVVLENLDADVVYVFSVKAHTSLGPGPWYGEGKWNSNMTLWSETAKNTVLGHSLPRSLVRSHRSLVRSLAHFAHSLARGKVND